MLGSTTRWRRRLFGLPIWFSRGRQCHQLPLCSWRPRARRTRLSARWVECKRTAIASDKPGSSWSSANSPSRPVKLPLVGCPCRNPNATASFRSTWGMVLLISPMEHPRTRHWLGGGVRCSHPCDRNDCLKRARAEGRAQCGGWRLIKHGTQVADGAWAHVKRAGPQGIKSSQHDRIAEYVNAWAWKARRTGDYFFQVLAREPAP